LGFDVIYWRYPQFEDRRLAQALEELAGSSDRGVRHRGFGVLLNSDDISAVGIALDYYHRQDSYGRWGQDNEFSDYAATVLQRARMLLTQPALGVGELGAAVTAANHASALVAMLNLAEAPDAEAIAQVLETTTSEAARENALMTAGTALETSAEPSVRLVEALSAIVGDESADVGNRCDALSALSDADSPKPLGAIRSALECVDLRVQTQAAYMLAFHHRDEHLSILRRVVASWPDDAPFPADEVRDLL
jgi:hypothetical protein